jgi:hypothetical protein
MISEKNTVMLDALNLIANSNNQCFCKCTYCYDKSNHIFGFDVGRCTALDQLNLSDFNFPLFIKSLLNAIDFCNNNGILSCNISDVSEDIFFDGKFYQFIYLPVNLDIKKSNLSVSCSNMLSVFKSKSKVVVDFLKSIKKLNDKEVINQMKLYCENSDISTSSNFNVDQQTASDIQINYGSYEDSEGETTVLNSYMQDDNADFEGETTVLNSYTQDDNADSEGETTVLNSYTQDDNADSEGETTVLNSYMQDDNANSEGETTVLNSHNTVIQKFQAYLVRNKTGEMFEIPFSGASIGSIQTNNIVISNPSISRNHAKFIFEDNDIFIIDNNSTNGTLVEGTQVKPDVKNIVYNGSIIMLGNESFQLIVK